VTALEGERDADGPKRCTLGAPWAGVRAGSRARSSSKPRARSGGDGGNIAVSPRGPVHTDISRPHRLHPGPAAAGVADERADVGAADAGELEGRTRPLDAGELAAAGADECGDHRAATMTRTTRQMIAG
jgi:hypothetical protein